MTTQKMKLKFFLLIIFPLSLNAQREIPHDTSYTVYSTYEKLLKDYPFIEIVTPRETSKVVLERELVYNSYGERDLHLDLFLPLEKGNGPFPGVIIIHGGGWRSGDKSMNYPMALELAVNNYVAATVEYRLSPEAKYPAAIYDLKAAVRWMKANAQHYNIDTTKIVVLGFSAGGTLAVFLGTTNGNNKFEGEGGNKNHSSDVQAIVDIDGILDFTDPAESGKDDDPLKPSVGKLWFDYSYKENPEIWKEASPVNYVNENTAPIVFINSSMERFHAGRDVMIEKLKSFNIYYEVHTIPDTPHSFWLFHPWFEKTSEFVINFLDKIFKKN
jgi:acetyl esterase/lipase